MHHRFHGLAAALTLSLPLLAAAQPRAEPADPRAPAHRSAFADYKPYRDIAPGDWRRLNDTVGAAALKPSAGAATAPAASAPAAREPMQPMQGHHHPMHGGSK